MASMTKAQMVEELEALRADLQPLRDSLNFHSQAYLPAAGHHVAGVDRALERVGRMLGEVPDDEAEAAPASTVEPTVPPGSVGGAAAHPETGATTNIPFSKPLAEGDTRSIPGTPGFDVAEMARVTRDSVAEQHAAEGAPDVELTGPATQTTVAPDGSTDAASSERIAAAQAEADARAAADVIPGVTPAQRDALVEAGFRAPADIRAATDEQLLAVHGVGPSTVTALREATKE